jgi:hypothetical protein
MSGPPRWFMWIGLVGAGLTMLFGSPLEWRLVSSACFGFLLARLLPERQRPVRRVRS